MCSLKAAYLSWVVLHISTCSQWFHSIFMLKCTSNINGPFFCHLKQDFYSGSIKRDLRGVFGLHATDKIFLYVYHELSMTFLFETLSKIFMIILSLSFLWVFLAVRYLFQVWNIFSCHCIFFFDINRKCNTKRIRTWGQQITVSRLPKEYFKYWFTNTHSYRFLNLNY